MVIKGKWNNKKYKLIKLIGSGNFGKVYKAIDSRKKVIAIKISKDLLSITNEYNAMVKLKNMPFVPKVYDFDDLEWGGEVCHFIVMDYIHGENLKEIDTKRKLNPQIIFKLGEVLINILREIDETGYKYTDIKLENIILDKRGNVYFVDFGCLVEKGKPTKEYTPPYNINSWNINFKYDYEISTLFSVTMIMVSLIGKKEFNPLICSLEQVIVKINDLPLKNREKQFLIDGLKGKFKNFNEYKNSLSSLIKGKKSYNGLSKIDYILAVSIVSFVFVIIIGIKSILS